MNRVKRFLFYLPGWYLVVRYVYLGLIPRPGFDSLADFRLYRDQFYLFYVVAFIILGIYLTVNRKSQTQNAEVKEWFPALITSLILTTFSHALAGLILDLLKLLKII